ncbi:MAG TPA: autotransporter-associated beta strand repeat-containing protein, partial [Xanthomonadales bacterium]|nr:autotransporter-associated beta strand repeat-containing protein [Xanthomonadales bacterium]
SGGAVTGGSAGPGGAGAGTGSGTLGFLAGSLDWTVTSGQTVTLSAGTTLAGGSDPLISGGLTKSGPGTLVLNSNNSYVGPTVVAAGQLRVNGNLLGTGAVSVANGATLAGSGTLSGATSVASGGILAPGQAAPGRLFTANVALVAGATFAAEITGATVATQYDQLDVTGTINLGGATLALSGAFVPTSGQSFVLIDNDASDAVTGTFAGLAQGSTLIFNGVTLSISYNGGDGNDVVLSAVVVDPCAAFVFPYTLVGADNTALVANLRQAIQCANANGGADTIDLNGQTVTMADSFADYSGATSLPQISSNISLQNGTLTRSGSSLFRIVSVSAVGSLTLRGTTISNGGGAGYASLGAGIHNLGTTTVINTNIVSNTGNQAVAIYSNNTLRVVNSTIAANSASTYSAILEMSGTATIANTVISGNRSATSDNISINSGTLTVSNSTVAYNYTAVSANNASGAFYKFPSATLIVQNSIIWGNRNSNNSSDQIEVSSGSPTVSNSIIEGGIFGSINAYPLFVTPIAVLSTPTTAGDFQLNNFSPAIDAGANANVPVDTFDVDGDT